MTNIAKSPEKKAQKTSAKNKWREIENIRDRFQLMKELRDDDYSLEMDMEDLGL
jgi:hypothetical protein